MILLFNQILAMMCQSEDYSSEFEYHSDSIIPCTHKNPVKKLALEIMINAHKIHPQLPWLHSSRPSSSSEPYKLWFMIGSTGPSKILRFHKHLIWNRRPFQHHRRGGEPRFSCLLRLAVILYAVESEVAQLVKAPACWGTKLSKVLCSNPTAFYWLLGLCATGVLQPA